MDGSEFPSFEHFRLSVGSTGHVWLTFDKADSSSNTLSSDVVHELSTVLEYLETRPDLPGLIFRSGKSSGFILGADVREFAQLDDAATAAKLAGEGQALLQRIEDLPFPTVALLNGYTLGGGMELALACRYRVAEEGYQRCMGLPEVQLGIHPGFGGTVRAVRVLGVPVAMDLMLTGRSLSPVEAARVGLVDRIAPSGMAETAAIKLLQRRPDPHRGAWYARLMGHSALRGIVASRLRKQVRAKARPEHYPAPYALIDLWQRHGATGPESYSAEAESIGQLLVSQTAQNLVRLFMLRERLRNLAPKSDAVTHVHVVGGGVMGGDIAAWCALRGMTVSVQDREEKFLEPAFSRAKSLFRKRLRAPGAAREAESRMLRDIKGAGVATADVIIEAIVEDLKIKQDLFRDLEGKARDEAVLATNTSSIRIEEIAAACREPGRLVGIHFFNPVASMPLVEVIRSDQTDVRFISDALAFVTQIGKLPLPCASAPGFLVNRILMPYMIEALLAFEDGHAIETIDAAARNFGMPMGPIELADRVGLDVARHVADILSQDTGGVTPATLNEMVEAGRLGVKSDGGGFYRYKDGKPIRNKHAAAPTAELTDRLVLTLINEAAACFSAGVVDDTDLLDAGVVFGTGFAPYTGGPVNYAKQCGRDDILKRLATLESSFGPRFAAHPGLHHIFPNP